MKVKATVFCLPLGIFIVLAGPAAIADTALPDGAFLKQMAQAQVEASQQAARLVRVKKQAAKIMPGTSRAQVEKIFPFQDGGLMSSRISRYYVGNGIMVDVPFDERGGVWKSQNRVQGALKVYLSPFHSD